MSWSFRPDDPIKPRTSTLRGIHYLLDASLVNSSTGAAGDPRLTSGFSILKLACGPCAES